MFAFEGACVRGRGLLTGWAFDGLPPVIPFPPPMSAATPVRGRTKTRRSERDRDKQHFKIDLIEKKISAVQLNILES